MAADVSVFGKPANQSIADQVMGSLSLNATGAPDQPEHMPSDQLANLYAQLDAIATEALKIEQDESRQQRLQEFAAFATTAMSDAINAAGSGGAPVPNIQLPAPPQPAAPMGAGNPPAATGTPPGAPPVPKPGAAA